MNEMVKRSCVDWQRSGSRSKRHGDLARFGRHTPIIRCVAGSSGIEFVLAVSFLAATIFYVASKDTDTLLERPKTVVETSSAVQD